MRWGCGGIVARRVFSRRVMAELNPNSPYLRRFWFRRPVGFGYGVTAYSVEDAEDLLDRAGLPRDWLEVVEDINVSLLDEGHVLPNLGGVTFHGIWFPAMNV